jgi:hypothetical protein
MPRGPALGTLITDKEGRDTSSKYEFAIPLCDLLLDVVECDIDGPDVTCCLNLLSVYDKSIVEGIVFALNDAPAHEISSRDGVLALVSLRQQFDLLWQKVDLYLEHPTNDREIRMTLAQYPDPGGTSERTKLIKQVRDIRAGNVRTQIQGIARAYEALKGSLDANESAATS